MAFLYHKKYWIILFIIILFQSVFFETKAQFYETGQLPPSTNWNQINSAHFQVIYPKEFENQAVRLTNYLELVYEHASVTRTKNISKVSVILNNQSLLSNGYVAWAPKRIELITTPATDNYAQPWLEQLAIHEYRHVIQLNDLNNGITKLLSVLFGEIAVGATSGYLPFWYLEGDAVVTETALTSSGRGRLPSFSMKLKANLLENKIYSYDKAYLGSYKHFIPDYYELGYQMVSHARMKQGIHFEKNINSFVGRNSYSFVPFHLGLKKYSGLSKTGLYKETIDSLRTKWLDEQENLSVSEYHEIKTNSDKYYTNYRFPHSVSQDSAIVIRSGLNDIARFVLLTNHEEKVLYTPGNVMNQRFSVSGNKIFWLDYAPDVRWQKKILSHIRMYNYKTHKKKNIGKKGRYLSLALSNDGSKLAVVHIGLDNAYSVIIFETHSGKVVHNMKIDNYSELTDICWGDKNTLFGILTDTDGKKLVELNPEENKLKYIFNSEFVNISQPVFSDGSIYFNYAYNNKDDIYKYDLKTNTISQITSVPVGAFDPNIGNNNMLYFSTYTSHGYKPAKTALNNNNISLINIKNTSNNQAEILSRQENNYLQLTNHADSVYTGKPYYSISGLVNIHSWMPFYLDYETDDYSQLPVYPGLTVFTQDKLSTLTGSVSYYYEGGYHHFKPELIYSGFFPVFSFSADYGGKPEFKSISQNENIPDHPEHYYKYSVSSSIPVSIRQSKYSQYFLFDIEYNFTNSYYYHYGYKKGISYVDYLFYFSNSLKRSTRDIQNRWRQSLLLRYRDYFNSDFTSLFSVLSNLNFPGIARHHVFKIGLGYEKQTPALYSVSNYLSLPRGYTEKNLSIYLFNLYRAYTIEEIKNIRFGYLLPLSEPDLALGSLVYIKRFYMIPFYDLSKINVVYQDENDLYHTTANLSSLGAELYADVHFLRFVLATFTPGLRTGYTLESNDITFEFLFQINL